MVEMDCRSSKNGAPSGCVVFSRPTADILILRPKRPYSNFFSPSISSCIVSRRPFNVSTSPSILSVDASRSSRTSGCGKETKQSPILYLYDWFSGYWVSLKEEGDR
ncbi:unnamed protein product [Periconia digitata]|uniref:Uncharacterized protein n=1 Tax=Periconia digitata TaxID=1303443 RepID=A0A9W4UJJ3_9PLEO|nr:unnamed protein product [Periconia digitata]